MTTEGNGVFDAERLIRLGRVGALAAAPGGDWVAVAVQRLDADGGKYVSDLWRVPLDGSGPSQLTRGLSRDATPCFRRDGALGFLSNRPVGEKAEEGDDERSQVWLLPAGGGEPRPLTDEPLGVSAFRFAADGDRLACLVPLLPGVPHEEQREVAGKRKKRGPSALHYRALPVRYWDHWLPEAAPHVVAFDESGGARRDLTPDAELDHREAELDLSRDGRHLAVTRLVRADDRMLDTQIVVIDLEGDERWVLGEPREELGQPLFSPDGQHLAFLHHVRSKERAGRVTLRVVDLEEGGEGREVVGHWDRWPIPAAWTVDGAALLVTADDGACTPVFRVDVGADAVTRVTAESAGGSHEQLVAVADGRRIVGLRSTFFHPPEPFVVDLGGAGEPRLLAELSGFTEAEGREVARVDELDVTSTDGERVQTWVIEPVNSDGPRPSVLWIHGGPMGAWHDGWHWRWNPLVLAARGYAVGLPNPRGSTGFGQDFVEGIWGNVWGAQCFEDVMASADALAARDGVEAGRMAAMGGSFGGYMTNWIGANTDRFRCLVTHASVFSMSVFYGDTDLPSFWALMMGGYPYGDQARFDRYSPSRHLERWRTPTLIIHGERDYRVPISQALHLFEGLDAHGVEAELLVFPDENHWILKPRNIVAWHEAVLEYLGRHLADG